MNFNQYFSQYQHHFIFVYMIVFALVFNLMSFGNEKQRRFVKNVLDACVKGCMAGYLSYGYFVNMQVAVAVATVQTILLLLKISSHSSVFLSAATVCGVISAGYALSAISLIAAQISAVSFFVIAAHHMICPFFDVYSRNYAQSVSQYLIAEQSIVKVLLRATLVIVPFMSIIGLGAPLFNSHFTIAVLVMMFLPVLYPVDYARFYTTVLASIGFALGIYVFGA